MKQNNSVQDPMTSNQPQHHPNPAILYRATNDFVFFVENIFALSTDIFKNETFVGGAHPRDIATWLQGNKKTMRVSAKDHFKSMSFYAHFMWKLLQHPDVNMEAHYFSFEESMAAYHVAKIKSAIKNNPYYAELKDLKPTAESVIKYSWNYGRNEITMDAHGMLAFKRGIHCKLIYVDDALQDPSNKLDPVIVKKVNDVMRNQILDMTWDELHVAGTAQTKDDFYFDKNFGKRFSVRIMPAIKDDAKKIVLWPEWTNYDELMAKRAERGAKSFEQEYLCVPAYSADSFFTREQLTAITNPGLKNYRPAEKYEPKDKEGKAMLVDVIGGWDLGKKRHPAHFCAYAKLEGKRVQLCSKWFDGSDYTQQLEWIAQAIESWKIDYVFYDNTRGELEALDEKGELPAELHPVAFTSKMKNAISTLLDKAVTNKEIELLNDQRQTNQILAVNNDLQAAESPEGHGDSFWSTALTFVDEVEGGATMTVL